MTDDDSGDGEEDKIELINTRPVERNGKPIMNTDTVADTRNILLLHVSGMPFHYA